MLHVSIRRVKPGKAAHLREWLSELNSRSDEVRAAFAAETVRAEKAFVIPGAEGHFLLFISEASDLRTAASAYASSELPIDVEHRRVMAECLGERLGVEAIYDVAL